MKWVEVFKIYSLKQIKKEKILFFFTSLSIVIATSISLIVPVVNLENQNYLNSNIKDINGGDLSIAINGERTEAFQEKLNAFKDEGLLVTSSIIQNCYYLKSTNNIMGTIVIGDYGLKENEIILQRTLANSLNVKIGDKVKLDTKGNGKFTYKVKAIEGVSSGVDRDAELLGYGKVQKSNELRNINDRELIHIKGKNGEKLKNELLKISNSNVYTTIDDKKNSMKEESIIQNATLGILSTVAYIFSILSIISTIIMLIIKRKKDIAILRLIFIDKKEIKKAICAEISLWLLPSIILSGFLSYYGAKVILNISGITISNVSSESLLLIAQGTIFNALMFFIFINVALIIIDGINAMVIIRAEEQLIKKEKKIVIGLTCILIPLFLVIYSLYSRSIEILWSSLLVVIVIGIFLSIVSLMIKILSYKGFRSSLMLYSIKSIKNRYFSFILVLLSLTLTLWFILIGFSLENTIKNNFRASIEKILPYNYYVQSRDIKSLEEVLKNNKDIEGYIKTSDIDGKVVNENFNNMYRNVNISEINKDDYGVNYKIIQGKDLFVGEEGFIISDKMREMTSLDIGHILEVETSKGILKGVIKGVYESGGINTLNVLKENVYLGDEVNYFIKSDTGSFVEELRNSSVAAIGDMGDRLAANIASFMKIFRILSGICLLGTILFNINMVYMNYIKDEKNEEILIALGLGKDFVVKEQIIKMILLAMFSSIIALGLYYLMVNLFFVMLVNSIGRISVLIVFVNIIVSIIISAISFNIPLRRIRKKTQLNLLRDIN